MSTIIITYPNKGRDLKKFIIGLLKGGFATRVLRTQYTKSYTMEDNNLKLEEEKTLLISYEQEKYEKLIGFINKNHPIKNPHIITLTS